MNPNTMKPTLHHLQLKNSEKPVLAEPLFPAEDRGAPAGVSDIFGGDFSMIEMTNAEEQEEVGTLRRALGSVLIRHGESEGNAGLPTDSPGAIRLTARGYEQAEALARSVQMPPDRIVVSPFLRTQQTAQALIGRWPEVLVETWEVHEFTYLNPHNYVGTTEAQRGGVARAYWDLLDPDWEDGGGAESFRAFIGRVDGMLARLALAPECWTLVFTHGYFIKAVELRLADRGAVVDASLMEQFRNLRGAGVIDNCHWLPVRG